MKLCIDWLTLFCMFDTVLTITVDSEIIMSRSSALDVANICYIVFAIIHSSNSLMGYFMYIYALHVSCNVFQLNIINLQSILHTFTSIITLFHVLLNIFITQKKLFINCIVLLQNHCGSCYKFVDCYCCTFIQSPMTSPSTNQLELMIYGNIKVTTLNCKGINYMYICQNNFQNDINIPSHNFMGVASMNYNLIMIIQVICTIDSFNTVVDHISIEQETLTYLFNRIIIIFKLTRNAIALHYQWNECKMVDYVVGWMYFVFVVTCHFIYKPCKFKRSMMHSDMLKIVIDMIHCGNLHMHSFMDIYTTNQIFSLHFASICVSITTIFNGLSCIFMNSIAMEFNNDDDYKSYCLWLIYSITSSKSTIYDMIQWIKQYVSDLNDTLDRNNLKNDKTFNLTLSMYSFYVITMINHLLFEKLAFLQVFDTIIFVFNGYAHGCAKLNDIDDETIRDIHDIHFSSIFTSIAAIAIIFIQPLNIFINCIVIMINFNNDGYKSYYTFIHYHCSAFIQSIAIYLSIMVSELVIL